MRKVVIASAVRSAVGSFGGSLKPVNADTLAVAVINAAVERAGIQKSDVEEITMGHCRQTEDFSNTGRYAGLAAGFPVEVFGSTVMCACASGMLACRNAFHLIGAGDVDVVIAGGTESMTNAPFYLPNARWGTGTGTTELRDSITEAQFRSQPMDMFGRFNMGMTAENIAERHNISREDSDKFALMSQERALAAIKSGRFKEEIVPIEVPQGKKKPPLVFDTDEFPRETSMELLAKLPPAFKKDGGVVTAGNASGRNDGSSALLLMSEEKAKELGVTPLAFIHAISASAVDPRYMGMGPVPSTQKVMKMTGMNLSDMELIELNEAFAPQALACIRELNIEDRMDVINVNGGGVSLGHPIGSSGSRIMVTLIHEMKKRGNKLGLATLCIAGGMGMATVIEMM